MTNGVQYGYIDVKGKPVVLVKYDQVEMSKKGIIKLSFKTKQKDVWQYQYADSTGKVLGGKPYTQNKGFGYIYPYRFQNGKYLVISHYSEKEGRNEIGVMTINGKIVVPPKYDKVTPFLNGNGFIVERDQKFGIYNKAGKQIMPTVLDNYYHYSGKYLSHRVDLQFPVLCVLKNHYFYLTAEGKILAFTAKGHMTSGLSEWGRR